MQGWFIPNFEHVDAINECIQKTGTINPKDFSSEIDFNAYLDGNNEEGEPTCLTTLVTVAGKPIFTERVGNEQYNLWQEKAGFFSYDPSAKQLRNLATTPEGEQIRNHLPDRFLDIMRAVPLSVGSNEELDRLHRVLGTHLLFSRLPEFVKDMPEYGTIMWFGTLEEKKKDTGPSTKLMATFKTVDVDQHGKLQTQDVSAFLFKIDEFVSIHQQRLTEAKQVLNTTIPLEDLTTADLVSAMNIYNL